MTVLLNYSEIFYLRTVLVRSIRMQPLDEFACPFSKRKLWHKLLTSPVCLSLIGFALVGCTGSNIERSDSPTGTEIDGGQGGEALAKQVCNGETMSIGKDNCDLQGKEYWTEERMRKAKSSPMPKVNTPNSPSSTGETFEQSPSTNAETKEQAVSRAVPQPLTRTGCESEARTDSRIKETCEPQEEEYWTEERQRSAKSKPSPVAPLPDDLRQKEKSAVQSDEAITQPGQPPLIVTPTPENRN